MEPDHYSILGLAPGADGRAVREAFRAAALKHHPDVSSVCDSHERFIRVEQAYRILSDSKLRGQYDRVRFRRKAAVRFWWYGGDRSYWAGRGTRADCAAAHTAHRPGNRASEEAGSGFRAIAGYGDASPDCLNSFFSRVLDILTRR
jgi:curved DNA-binding protein CbpA